MPYDFDRASNMVVEKKSNFGFGATIAALVMAMIAFPLLLHTFATREWLTKIKAEAMTRAHADVNEAAAAPSKAAKCPAEKPVLIGFGENGEALCRALTSQTCGAGQYISSIDPGTYEIHCSDAGADVVCPTTSYITEFMWLGEGHVSFSCSPRLNPFEAWKFSPSLSSSGNY